MTGLGGFEQYHIFTYFVERLFETKWRFYCSSCIGPSPHVTVLCESKVRSGW
jgi:hypothetical protein